MGFCYNNSVLCYNNSVLCYNNRGFCYNNAHKNRECVTDFGWGIIPPHM